MVAKPSAAEQSPGARVVNCPQCGRPVPWTRESRYRPFCSERCKTIDLGAWAAEKYRVPVVEQDDDAPDDDGDQRDK
jgi:endogenous inhibitor of DNA gyrase (YacG/DUF329 family)